MDEIVKQFLLEVNHINNSAMFINDDENEPITEWVEEIDSRTNFPFYWNSKTNESIWDKPECYDEYLIEYEKYLKNAMENEFTEKAREEKEDNVKKRSDMRGLLGYSDSEDECDQNDGIVIQEKQCEEEPQKSEQEESMSCKRDNWMKDQVSLATEYLQSIIKNKSETAIAKVQSLVKEVPNGESLMPVGLRIQTRLEDWEGGYLTTERTVEKLQEALINISRFEGDLEPLDWKLQWDSEKMRYYFINSKTGHKKWNFGNGNYNYEDGEIVDDEDDLRDYVTSRLHCSLLESPEEVTLGEFVDLEDKQLLSGDGKENFIENKQSAIIEDLQKSDSVVDIEKASYNELQSEAIVNIEEDKIVLDDIDYTTIEDTESYQMHGGTLNEIEEVKESDKMIDTEEQDIKNCHQDYFVSLETVMFDSKVSDNTEKEDIYEGKEHVEYIREHSDDMFKRHLINEKKLSEEITERMQEIVLKIKAEEIKGDDQEIMIEDTAATIISYAEEPEDILEVKESETKQIGEIEEESSEILHTDSTERIKEGECHTMLEDIKRCLIENIDRYMLESLKEEICEGAGYISKEEIFEVITEDTKNDVIIETVEHITKENQQFGCLVDYQDEDVSEEDVC